MQYVTEQLQSNTVRKKQSYLLKTASMVMKRLIRPQKRRLDLWIHAFLEQSSFYVVPKPVWGLWQCSKRLSVTESRGKQCRSFFLCCKSPLAATERGHTGGGSGICVSVVVVVGEVRLSEPIHALWPRIYNSYCWTVEVRGVWSLSVVSKWKHPS